MVQSPSLLPSPHDAASTAPRRARPTSLTDSTSPAGPDRPTAAARVGSSAIRDLLALTERSDVISFAGGLPDPATFPADAIAAATSRVLATDPAAALQYSTTEGDPALRRWIAERRGAAATDVLVTHGSQQALDLVARTLLEPGDPVVLADPAYVGALQVLRLGQADLVGVPSDHDGLRVDLLADRLAAGLRPRLVYVVANFDNPSGASLSAPRRIALAELAERYGFWIVDDDPYGELHWSGRTASRAHALSVPLRQLSDRVVTLGSFSKILSPGLRLGYLVAPAALTRELTIIKQAADLHTSTLSQHVVHSIVAEPGFLDAHLDRIRSVYANRSAALADALNAEFGVHLAFERPSGGMFLWARVVGAPIDTHAQLALALAHGVAYVPGAAFAVERGTATPLETLRLSFAGAPVDAFPEGARRLRAALLP